MKLQMRKQPKTKARGGGKSSAGQRSDLNEETRKSGRGWGVLLVSLASTLLLLLAFPPVNFSPAAWIAPLGWVALCDRPTGLGRRDYLGLWLSGFLFWMVTLHSVRLAFWALIAGWIAMSLYLAVYLPLFVAATRIMLHRWRIPLVLAAPIAWTGLEAIRSVLFTGYAANTLAHSQAYQPMVIQIVDHLGTGGLSFIMVLASAVLWRAVTALVRKEGRQAVGAFAAVTAIVLGTVGYGTWRLRQADQLIANSDPLLRCLLLQENTPSIFEMNPNMGEYADRSRSAWTRYITLCRKAAQQHGKLDLVVWPESTFTSTSPLMEVAFERTQVPQALEQEMRQFGISLDEFMRYTNQSREVFDQKVRIALLAARGLDPLDALNSGELNSEALNSEALNSEALNSGDQNNGEPAGGELTNRKPTKSDSSSQNGPDLLVGCDHVRYTTDDMNRYNAAIWIGSDGTIRDTYAKMHLVMFGEYIPLEPLLGWLGDWFSFAGIQSGTQPKAFDVNGVRVAPNICFESMVPRLIRRQVGQLRKLGHDPDVLINLTNDSWFRGTSMLDHHLASSILCSVENRRPMLVAANTGLSAEIDGSGRVLQQSQRLTAEAILAQPHRDRRFGLVQAIGYPLSLVCSLIAVMALVSPAIRVIRPSRVPERAAGDRLEGHAETKR
jgi:apolipoprotein N-acyltransferase